MATGHRPHTNERGLFHAPAVAWGTVALVSGVAVFWSLALVGALLGAVPTWVCVLLATAAAHGAFTGMHDASHLALGRDARLSVLAGELCATVLLVRFQAFRQVHLRHHKYTNDPERDPDRWTGIGPRWQLPLRWATTDLNYYLEYHPEELDIPGWQNAISWLSGGVLLGAIAALLLSGHGLVFVFCWLLPARIALFIAAYAADYLPHVRPHGTPRGEHRYRHTIVVRGRFVGFLLLGHDMHLVHHLYPAVPFYRCARIWRHRRDELLARGAREFSIREVATPFIDQDALEDVP